MINIPLKPRLRQIGVILLLFLQLGRHVAPFKRNEAMLDVLPIDVMVFPGTLASRTNSPTRPASSAFRSGGCGTSRA